MNSSHFTVTHTYCVSQLYINCMGIKSSLHAPAGLVANELLDKQSNGRSSDSGGDKLRHNPLDQPVLYVGNHRCKLTMLAFVFNCVIVKPLGNGSFRWLSGHGRHLNAPAEPPLAFTPSNGRTRMSLLYSIDVLRKRIIHKSSVNYTLPTCTGMTCSPGTRSMGSSSALWSSAVASSPKSTVAETTPRSGPVVRTRPRMR